MTQAFSPDDAVRAKAAVIPAFVIEAVNQLLAERFNGKGCIIKQSEVVARATQICSAAGNEPLASRFYSGNWLDFEPLYEQRGWKVTYDKPGYFNADTEAYWRFDRDTRASEFDRQLVQI